MDLTGWGGDREALRFQYVVDVPPALQMPYHSKRGKTQFWGSSRDEFNQFYVLNYRKTYQYPTHVYLNTLKLTLLYMNWLNSGHFHHIFSENQQVQMTHRERKDRTFTVIARENKNTIKNGHSAAHTYDHYREYPLPPITVDIGTLQTSETPCLHLPKPQPSPYYHYITIVGSFLLDLI